jgi:hypothetical protein
MNAVFYNVDCLAREALGSFATGVTIVTTVDQGGRDIGLTAESTRARVRPSLFFAQEVDDRLCVPIIGANAHQETIPEHIVF